MKQLTTPTGQDILCIPVPKDAKNIRCHTQFNELTYLIGTQAFEIELPAGQWEIVGMTSELTDEQCTPLVEREWDGTAYWYVNYNKEHMDDASMFKRQPVKSFLSFLQSQGINVKDNILILKKKEK